MIVFYTHVYEIGASPLGLLPARWAVSHRCSRCRCEVTVDELVAHAKLHADDPDDDDA